jgi:hypothetical protein
MPLLLVMSDDFLRISCSQIVYVLCNFIYFILLYLSYSDRIQYIGTPSNIMIWINVYQANYWNQLEYKLLFRSSVLLLLLKIWLASDIHALVLILMTKWNTIKMKFWCKSKPYHITWMSSYQHKYLSHWWILETVEYSFHEYYFIKDISFKIAYCA